ncbi:MAG: hypothetical protein SFX73_34130 [Kofleriaceae bacterium]|nr:hypothetical protein [Kofleriaceae bacterium]
MDIFKDRVAFTNDKLVALERHLLAELGPDRERVLKDDTAIYVTGSGGRGEMSAASDVDLFIARISDRNSPVDAFHFQQAVARTFHAMQLPEPSNDGQFLKVHSATSLCGLMGKPTDDTENTLTARMLLLLESACLPSTTPAYRKLLQRVLASYWKDSEYVAQYQPLTLVNDIVRYWRTLILNYVAKNADKEQARSLDAAERRARSYKLRFSRCLTCFSMLSYLLALTGTEPSVTQEHVMEAVEMKPIERLHGVRTRQPTTAALVDKLVELYGDFLAHSGVSKHELIAAFGDPDYRRARSREASAFGDTMYDLLMELGKTDRGLYLLRYMLV